MEAVDVRGRFVWHQLMTRDVPGAKQFYTKLVGWKAMPWPLDPAYTVCYADSDPVAGIVQIPADLPGEVPSHWVQYIGTRDVDATADAAVRAGGSVIKPPQDMAGAGRYALLSDPQGAIFAIIDPEKSRPEPEGPPPVGLFSWHELATTDHEAAFAFYSALFGWQALRRVDMGPGVGIYLIFGVDGVDRGGMYIKPADMPAPPHWLPYARVANCDGACEAAKAAGGSLHAGPMEVPGGSRVAILMDPSGAGFALHALPAAAAAPAEAKRQVRAKLKAKAKAKSRPKVKSKSAKKPAAKKKVVRKAARKPAAKKSKRARRKK